MKISEFDRAHILSRALPYIQQYSGKTIVVKYGGNAMIDEELKSAVMNDIALLSLVGIHVVLVHGGGPEITEMLGKLGIESRFVGGLRYTDKATVEVVQEVLAGKINKDLVKLITCKKGRAIGLCGIDGGMIKAKKKKTANGEDIGYVGEIVSVDTTIIDNAFANGFIPVIATVATDSKGNTYNINADTGAAHIAAALGAEKLMVLTDIKGVMRDKDDESTLISQIKVSDVPGLISEGIISGGMIPKVECCVEAVRRGVSRAHVIDGRRKHSILVELLSDEGIGTMFY